MQDLVITLIQTELFWENIPANLAMLEEKIWQIDNPTDLIILPEMFSTGFTMNAEAFAEHMNMTTFKWMKQQAAQTGAVIAGSFIVKEQGKYYNRLIWMEPGGNSGHYDKRHLFRMVGEDGVFSAGMERLIVELKGWKICPLICYDLRFPVWSRNVDNAYDLLIYVANWPEARKVAWRTLLQARAIENLAFVAGVNRVGDDGKGIHYSGDSCLIGPKGDILYHKEEQEDMVTLKLEKQALNIFREKFPAHLDADRFDIH